VSEQRIFRSCRVSTPPRVNARACAFVFAVVASLGVSPGARGEDTLNIATWGGAYGQSQEIAFFEPYAKETGTRIATEIYDGSLAKLKDMIGGDNAAIDVADVSAGVLNALCKDGLLETIATSSLGAAPSGESAEQDFFADSLSSCGVGSVAWAMTIAIDRQAFGKGAPSQVANLLDTKRFAGKRALPNSARRTLELALLADGVEPANVYTELATQAGADRAFKALDKIKAEVFWWDNAEEAMTWLLERKAVMAATYSGRLFRATVGTRQRYAAIWDGQIYDLDLWAIPKSAKNKDGALRFIAFATDPARLAAQAQLIAYGPVRKSALPLVGKHPVIDVAMLAFLPTAPDNFKKALKFDEGWWDANGAALESRFEAWRGPLSPGQGKPPTAEAKPEEAEAGQETPKAAP
jgi:putative spermidine/putrescine transport system substrate-binding protein